MIPNLFLILSMFAVEPQPGAFTFERDGYACLCVRIDEPDESHPPPPIDEAAPTFPPPPPSEPTDDNPCPPSD